MGNSVRNSVSGTNKTERKEKKKDIRNISSYYIKQTFFGSCFWTGFFFY